MEQDSVAGFAQVSPTVKGKEFNDIHLRDTHYDGESFSHHNSPEIRNSQASLAWPANSTRSDGCDAVLEQLGASRRGPALLRRKKYHDADFHIARRSNRCRWTAGDAPSREVSPRPADLDCAKYAGSRRHC